MDVPEWSEKQEASWIPNGAVVPLFLRVPRFCSGLLFSWFVCSFYCIVFGHFSVYFPQASPITMSHDWGSMSSFRSDILELGYYGTRE